MEGDDQLMGGAPGYQNSLQYPPLTGGAAEGQEGAAGGQGGAAGGQESLLFPPMTGRQPGRTPAGFTNLSVSPDLQLGGDGSGSSPE